jgi:hypothetical protein
VFSWNTNTDQPRVCRIINLCNFYCFVHFYFHLNMQNTVSVFM